MVEQKGYTMPNIKNIAITAVTLLGLAGFSYLYLKDDSTQLKQQDMAKVNSAGTKSTKDVPIVYTDSSKKKPTSLSVASSKKKTSVQVSSWKQDRDANPAYQRYKAYQRIVTMREKAKREFEANLKRKVFLQKSHKEKMMKIAMAKRDRLLELKRRQTAKILHNQHRNQTKMINKAARLHLNVNGS